MRRQTLNVLGFTRTEQGAIVPVLKEHPGSFASGMVNLHEVFRVKFASPSKVFSPPSKNNLSKFRIAPGHFGLPEGTTGKLSGADRIPTHTWRKPFGDSAGEYVRVEPTTVHTPADGGAVASLLDTVLARADVPAEVRTSVEEASAVAARHEQIISAMQREMDALRKAHIDSSYRWIERPRTGPSPGLRFECVQDSIETCTLLFSFPPKLFVAIFNLCNASGYLDKAVYRADVVRSAAARFYGAATGGAAVPPPATDVCDITDGFAAELRGLGGAKKTLTTINEFALFLSMLTIDPSQAFAAWLWGVSETIVSNTFVKMALSVDKFFAVFFRPWDAERALAATPAALDARHGSRPGYAGDCMEQFMHSPSDGALKAAVYSQYKGTNTFKYFVLTSLGGVVAYVSDPYCGGETDDDILAKCWPRLQRFLPPGAIIYVDKGYHLTKMMQYAIDARVSFAVPPTAERRTHDEVKAGAILQYEPHQTDSTGKVANTRIVVENFIGRASAIYGYLKSRKPVLIADTVGPATRVAFFLCNFRPPLSSGGAITAKKERSAPAPGATLGRRSAADGEEAY